MTDDMADVFQRAFPNISPHHIQRIREMQRRVECERLLGDTHDRG